MSDEQEQQCDTNVATPPRVLATRSSKLERKSKIKQYYKIVDTPPIVKKLTSYLDMADKTIILIWREQRGVEW